MGRNRAQRPEVTQHQILAEYERRHGDSELFQGLLQLYKIDWQQIRTTKAVEARPPHGYEALLDLELEYLYNVSGAGPAHPNSLLLRPNERREQIVFLEADTMGLISQREQVEGDEISSLREVMTPYVQTALSAAIDRCLGGNSYYFPDMPRSWKDVHLRGCANDPGIYTPLLTGPDSTIPGVNFESAPPGIALGRPGCCCIGCDSNCDCM